MSGEQFLHLIHQVVSTLANTFQLIINNIEAAANSLGNIDEKVL